MVVWYIVSTIFLVLGAILVIWGAYNLFRGIRYEDPYGDFFTGVRKLSFAIFLALMLWAIGFPWGGAYFEWIKMFVTEHATTLKFIAAILFCTVGVPFIGICLFVIRWFVFDPTKKASNESKDDKERES